MFSNYGELSNYMHLRLEHTSSFDIRCSLFDIQFFFVSDLKTINATILIAALLMNKCAACAIVSYHLSKKRINISASRMKSNKLIIPYNSYRYVYDQSKKTSSALIGISNFRRSLFKQYTFDTCFGDFHEIQTGFVQGIWCAHFH